MPRGERAQTRRRTRRDVAAGSSRALSAVTELSASGATTFTDLPLSDRTRLFDGQGALDRWRDHCGPDTDKYHGGFLYVPPPNETVAYALPDMVARLDDPALLFADVLNGKPMATWRAIVKAAGMLHAGRWTLPPDQLEAVKAHIGQYYAKARSVFDDALIEEPWRHGNTEVSLAIARLAHAEVSRNGGMDLLAERWQQWCNQFAVWAVVDRNPDGAVVSLSVAEAEPTPERMALERARRIVAAAEGDAPMPCADCGDDMARHAGDDNMGACTVDGCECEGMVLESSAATRFKHGVVSSEPVLRALDATRVGPDEDGVIRATGVDRTNYELFMRALEDVSVEYVELARHLPAVREKMTLRLQDFELATDGEATLPEQPDIEGVVQWVATIVPEGELTDDGRAFAPGAVTWRDLPLSLCAMLDSPHADAVTNAAVCGRIDTIWREGNLVRAAGIFDEGKYGQEIASMVDNKTLRGISVDIAVHASEVRPYTDFFDENDQWRDEPIESDVDMMDVLFGESDVQPIFVVTLGVIGSVTVCPFAAFARAIIETANSLTASVQAPNLWTITSQNGMVITDPRAHSAPGTGTEMSGIEVPPDGTPHTLTSGGLVPVAGDRVPVLLSPGYVLNHRQVEQLGKFNFHAPGAASLAAVLDEIAGTDRPPVEAFANPGFEELTPLTVTDDLRVIGHAAGWGICHISIPDVCTTAPHSVTDYECFHLKEVVCADGTRVAVGTITLDTGHAGRGLGANHAAAHYDDTGTAVADVCVGEDEHGIWVAGILRPGLSGESVRKLQGAVLSGDWRRVELTDGSANLELVALLAVNVPGFPIPRTRANIVASADGMEVVTLLAAGALMPTEGEMSDEQVALKIAALVDAARIQAIAAKAKAA